MMKKERKGLGSTNLTSARGTEVDQHPTSSSASTTPTPKPNKSVLQRLLEQSLPEPLNDPKARSVPFRATWNSMHPPSQSTFSTTHRVDYSKDVSMSKSKGFRRTAEESASRHQNLEQDPVREGLRQQALEKLRGLSKSHYGSMTKMMKAFRKKHGDTITPHEFADNLRKIKLDSSLTGIEQDLIFEHFLVHKAAKERISRPLNSSAQEPLAKVLPTSEVDVTAILARIDEADSNDPKIVERKGEMLNVRNFLAEKVAERRAQKEKESGGLGNEQDSQQQRLEAAAKAMGVENEDVLMKRAIGQRTFDLDVDAEELNDMIEDMYHTKQENGEHDMFVRYLRHTNLKLHDIPFYDLRMKELQGYKLRAAALEAKRNSPRTQARLKELHERKHKNNEYERQMELLKTLEKRRERDERMGIVTDGSHPLQPGRMADAPSSYRGVAAEESDYQSTNDFSVSTGGSSSLKVLPTHTTHIKPAASPEGKGLFKHKVPGPDTLRPAINNPITSPEDILKSHVEKDDPEVKQPHELPDTPGLAATRKNLTVGVVTGGMSAHGGGGGDIGAAPPASNTSNSLLKADSSDRPTLRSSHSLPHVLDFNQSHPSDFYPKLIRAGKTKDMDGSSIVLYRPHYEHEEPKETAGRKLFPKGETDWSRVGYGTGEPVGRFVAGTDSSHYSTTNSSYYPELIYEPSKPIQRDLTSDAEKASHTREERRFARFERKEANIKEMKHRLETEELDREVMQLKRAQRINEDTIRYQTTVFLNDVKSFRLQPLQMMLRKPFLSKSDKMWGGSQRNSEDREDRDFNTTYNKSFDSSILRSSSVSNNSMNSSGWGNLNSQR